MAMTKKLRRRGTAIVEYEHAKGRGVLVHADHEGNWLLPGGAPNGDRRAGRAVESRLAAAARALREETGLEAYSATLLFSHQSALGDHKVFYLLAQGAAGAVDPRGAPAIGVCDELMTITAIDSVADFDPGSHTLTPGSRAIIQRYRELRRLRPGLFRALAAARLEPGADALAIGAVRGDWQAQPMPHQRAQLAVERVYTAEEMRGIRAGLIPEQMEDKWFAYYEGDTLYLHRSWTGFCIYQAQFLPHGEGCALSTVLVNRNPEQHTSTDDADDARRLLALIDGLFLGRPAAPAVARPTPDRRPAPRARAAPAAPGERDAIPELRLLDQLSLTYRGAARTIAIYHGDLTAMPAGEAVDLLVVSALPESYRPSRSSLIGALHRRGVSVEALARRKAADMRPHLACWLSEPVRAADPGIQFQRILCFEPLQRGAPPEVVGDIFQCLISVSEGGTPVRSIAMPLLAGGVHGVGTVDILMPLFDAATHWMQVGLPIETIKIVAHDAAQAAELRGAFGVLRRQFEQRPQQAAPRKAYDLFISYSWKNRDAVDAFVAELRRLRPGLRLFLDRQVLQTGCAWQQDIFAALDDCRKIVAFYSPDYLGSKVCREEYNIALFRQRDEGGEVLLPIYLDTAQLPTYMKLIQYIDCRAGLGVTLAQAAAQIAAKL